MHNKFNAKSPEKKVKTKTNSAQPARNISSFLSVLYIYLQVILMELLLILGHLAGFILCEIAGISVLVDNFFSFYGSGEQKSSIPAILLFISGVSGIAN